MPFVYRHARLVRVIDGDTAVLEIDMGNRILWVESFRLNGIDAPEIRAPGGVEAKTHLEGLLSNGVSRVETFKPDKFGRWLADIHIAVNGGEALVNKLMELDGHAAAYFGGKR